MGEGEKSEPWRRVPSVKPRLQNKNTVKYDNEENESHDREEVRNGVHNEWSQVDIQSFFFLLLQSDGVCYTLESDISIGPGSFAGSGP